MKLIRGMSKQARDTRAAKTRQQADVTKRELIKAAGTKTGVGGVATSFAMRGESS